jgi:serine/threonine protein kinase
MTMNSQPISTTQPPQPIQFGKYLLVERLGRGGMAEVWKARIMGPAGFQRTMVVKRILPHLVEDPHFVQMFVAEARLSARLNHANIVHVFELGDVEGEYFLAMEYVRGRDLVNVMRAQLMKGVPPPGLGAFVVRDVCRALGYAHSLTDDYGAPLRLIHRDVSPSNVMLAFDGAVKLLDFGIAKALAEASENKTQTGTLKGKFGYMSPEQVEGKEVDHRSDLFAAGIVLHESLTGRRLFKGAHDLQTISLVREAKIEPPSHVNPDVPPELDRICLKALARLPEDRYRNCEDMAQELDQLVYQLKWGPERLTQMLRDLFPEEPSNTGQLVIGADVPSGLTIGTLRGHERRQRVAIGVAAAVLLGGAGVTWYFVLNRHKAARVQVAEAAAPVTPVEKTAAPPQPTVKPLAEVRVRVRSNPPGAQVFFDRETESRGLTPFDERLPRAENTRTIRLELAGYKSNTIEVGFDSNSMNQVTLQPLPVPQPKHVLQPKPKPKPKAAAPATKTKPDLEKGEIVDPFAR